MTSQNVYVVVIGNPNYIWGKMGQENYMFTSVDEIKKHITDMMNMSYDPIDHHEALALAVTSHLEAWKLTDQNHKLSIDLSSFYPEDFACVYFTVERTQVHSVAA